MGMPSRVGPVAILGLLWAAMLDVGRAAEGHQVQGIRLFSGGQNVELGSGNASAASTRRGRRNEAAVVGFVEGGEEAQERAGRKNRRWWEASSRVLGQ